MVHGTHTEHEGEGITARLTLRVVISRAGVVSASSQREEQKGGAHVHYPLSSCRPRVRSEFRELGPPSPLRI